MCTTIRHLRLLLRDCGEGLCSHYADQVALTGTKTTTEDAFDAWNRWLAVGNDLPFERPFKLSDWGDNFHERAAFAIRNVARYVQ